MDRSSDGSDSNHLSDRHLVGTYQHSTICHAKVDPDLWMCGLVGTDAPALGFRHLA